MCKTVHSVIKDEDSDAIFSIKGCDGKIVELSLVAEDGETKIKRLNFKAIRRMPAIRAVYQEARISSR